jgi:hypothetical protein
MEKVEVTKGVEVLRSQSIDAIRRYLKDGTDYRAAFEEDSLRAQHELEKAADRQAAKKLATQE